VVVGGLDGDIVADVGSGDGGNVGAKIGGGVGYAVKRI